MRTLALVTAVCLMACTPQDDEVVTDDSSGEPEALSVVGFNVESGGAFDDRLVDVFANVQGEGIWGTTETLNAFWPEKFAAAAADDGVAFHWVMGETGWEDRIAILWDDARFELLSHEELQNINVGGTARAPLVGHFRSRSTGTEFLFMVNHLWRSETASRHEQARLLNAWALEQTLPVVAVGDYNFDWEVVGGENDHDQGYDLMTANGVWEWVRPDVLIETQCSSSFDSVLDFVFVAGAAQSWGGTSEILEAQSNYCPDNSGTSDHRPVRGDFLIP
ncbi:MAG: endonuclease/exonuclease/phosphatase [Proteobacteria bacterium]|nr:endonuclease/exonuclease/phosphatase [Pseudomonadota bacterium]